MSDDVGPAKPRSAWQRNSGFYASVGQAISAWASMEGSLVELAAKLLGTSNEKTGLLLYSTNFFKWIEIIDELFSLEKKYESQKVTWGGIAKKLRSLNDTRVRLAHHTIWDGREGSEDVGLRPGRHDVRSKSKKYAALSREEVLSFTVEVMDVVETVDKTINEMAEFNGGSLTSLFGAVEHPGKES